VVALFRRMFSCLLWPGSKQKWQYVDPPNESDKESNEDYDPHHLPQKANQSRSGSGARRAAQQTPQAPPDGSTADAANGPEEPEGQLVRTVTAIALPSEADPTGLASPSLYFLQILCILTFLRIFPRKLSRFLMLSLLLLHHLLHSHLYPVVHPSVRLVMAALPRLLPSSALRNKPRRWQRCALASRIGRSLASMGSPTRPSIGSCAPHPRTPHMRAVHNERSSGSDEGVARRHRGFWDPKIEDCLLR
jgi:hypothetical protein